MKKINPDQILTVVEENDAHNFLYDSDDNNSEHANYQGMLENKDNDSPR